MRAEDGFVGRFRTLSGGALPGETLDRWRQVVEDCRDGYEDCPAEYDHDLGVRRTIAVVLADAEMRRCPELDWFREQVAEIDLGFRALLQDVPDPRRVGRPWWESCPPRCAGPELAAGFLEILGVRAAAPPAPGEVTRGAAGCERSAGRGGGETGVWCARSRRVGRVAGGGPGTSGGGSCTVPTVFEFKDEQEERSRWGRIAGLSGAFAAMVGLTVVGILVALFVLFYVTRAIQD